VEKCHGFLHNFFFAPFMDVPFVGSVLFLMAEKI